jgi:hypothetical protein
MTQTVVNVPAAGAFDPSDITITDNTSGAFLIKDDSGSPTEYMRIDTTSGAELTKFVVHDDGVNANKFVVSTDRSGSDLIQVTPRRTGLGDFEGVLFSGSSSTQVWVNGPSRFRIQQAEFIHNMTGTQYADTYIGGTGSWKVRGTGGDIAKFDYDSNMTFTLDDGSGATFTIADNASPTPALHLRCTESASTTPLVEVNGLMAFPTRQLQMSSITYGTAFYGSANQARLSVSLGATSATRNVNIGAVNMDNFAQILTATPSTTGQTFTLDFNNTSTALSGLPISLYKLVLKNAGTESCTFTAASTMASGGRVKGVDISGASIGVIDSSSGSITAAAGETIYVEVTNHVSDSAGGLSNRFIICKTICKI